MFMCLGSQVTDVVDARSEGKVPSRTDFALATGSTLLLSDRLSRAIDPEAFDR